MQPNSGSGRAVLVTGAGGFVGRALVPRLLDRGDRVRALVRAGGRPAPPGAETVAVADMAAADWPALVAGADAVVHLAARVHRAGETGPDAVAAYRRDNTDATRALAEAAAAAGVGRFVLVSTAHVVPLVEAIGLGRTTEAAAWAEHPYGMSKAEAEAAVLRVRAATGLPAVVLRPPLVYGPGAVANFAALLKAVRWGLPLPLGAVRNRRSLVYVGNLAAAVEAALDHPAAPGHVFAVSDDDDVSTPELVRRLARALGRRAPWMPAVPPPVLARLLRLAGREGWIERLTGDAFVDAAPLRETLGWTPPHTMDEGLRSLRAG
jgi:nucleoside-diphosphate-sugar epimerase